MFGLSQFEEKTLLVLRSNISAMTTEEIASRAIFTAFSTNTTLIRITVEEALFGLRGGEFVDLTFGGWELTDKGYNTADKLRAVASR